MADKKGGSTVSQVWRLAQPIAQQLGLMLWDVRFLKEGAQWYLRIFIDKEEGITIEDCEAMSRAVDKPLDEWDGIAQSYCLEVCSPGLERDLVRPEHFARFEGWPVKVKLIRALPSGQKELGGRLGAYEDGAFTLYPYEEGAQPLTIQKKETSHVKLDDFDNDFTPEEDD